MGEILLCALTGFLPRSSNFGLFRETRVQTTKRAVLCSVNDRPQLRLLVHFLGYTQTSPHARFIVSGCPQDIPDYKHSAPLGPGMVMRGMGGGAAGRGGVGSVRKAEKV